MRTCQKIAYPKPDELSFDKLTNVAFSYTNHAEDQPVHLKVCDWELQKTSGLGEYDGPSNRYCPPASTNGSPTGDGRDGSRSIH